MEVHKQQKASMEAEKAEQKRKVSQILQDFNTVKHHCNIGSRHATEISTMGKTIWRCSKGESVWIISSI